MEQSGDGRNLRVKLNSSPREICAISYKYMSNKTRQTFETPEQLHAWLRVNHASETELWVNIFKKASGQPTVTWDDCVVAAIGWGWIEGPVRFAWVKLD